MTRNWLVRLCALVLFVTAFSFAHAQDNAAMTGVVTDATGAAITDVKVTLLNPSRGIDAFATTAKDGSYRFPNVPPAPGYKVTFSHDGFASVEINDITLLVASTRTQNATMSAGQKQTVEVSASSNEATLNTTDATIGNNFDIQIINDLPIQNRNSPASLFFLQPGVNSFGAVTGARTDQTSVTVDGMDVNDLSTGQFGNTNGGMPVDATQEFKGTVAGLTANLGTGSGGQFQLVTKSGTNRFHGDLNEYHRDTVTTSNIWFNNNAGVGRTALVRNQFGGAIGGPIWRDKLFFFTDFNNSRIIASLAGADTVPLDSYRAGNVSYVKTGCATNSRQTTNPACIGTWTPADVKSHDPLGLGLSPALFGNPIGTGGLFNTRYPHANDLSGGDGVNTALYRFTQPTANILYNGVARLDYNLTSHQRIFLQYHNAHQDSVQSINRFPTDPLTRPFQDRSYGYVGSHTWEIGNNKVNQFYYGTNVTVFSFALSFQPPTSINPNPANIVGSLSGIITTPYDGSNIQRRRVPIPTFRDDFNWVRGTHAYSFGGTFKFIKASNYLGSDYNTYTLGLGGNLTSFANTVYRPSDLQSTGTTNTTQFDNAFALALGRVGRVSSIYNFDAAGNRLASGTGANRRYRYYQLDTYAGDTWKITKNLTLTYGLRYSYYSVPFETLGAEAIPNIGFDDYFNARIKQSQASAFTNSSVPLLVYNLAGKANNAPGFYQPNVKDLAPRFAFTYNPTFLPHTIINGSADIVYDRTVANAVNFLQNQSTFVFQNTTAVSYGTVGDPTASLTKDPRVLASAFGDLPAAPVIAAPSKPYTPNLNSQGNPAGLGASLGTTVIDSHLKDPYNITMNFGIQQEMPWHMIMRASYAGRLGRRLLGQADAAQLIDTTDTQSGQTLSQAFAYLTTASRAGVSPTNSVAQPFFEHVLPANYYAGRSCGTLNNQTVLCNSNTAFVAFSQSSFVNLGDITDALQNLASGGSLPPNVGLASQFARATYYTNRGFSNYHGLLFTINKNFSDGLKFDFNYTWSHSIDNVSVVANTSASGTGFICDALHMRACRGNSDFDTTHNITADFVYQLPFGKGRRFGSSIPWYLDEVIGGWQISGIPEWQSGQAFTTSTGAFLAGFANNDPAIFDGSYTDDIRTHLHKNSGNQLVQFNDVNKAKAHFRGPVGIEYGSRNNLRGPGQTYFDAGLAKTFRVLPNDRLNLKFKADAFNVLNHPTFGLPNAAINSASFGVNTTQTNTFNNATRVAQFSLRLEF